MWPSQNIWTLPLTTVSMIMIFPFSFFWRRKTLINEDWKAKAESTKVLTGFAEFKSQKVYLSFVHLHKFSYLPFHISFDIVFFSKITQLDEIWSMIPFDPNKHVVTLKKAVKVLKSGSFFINLWPSLVGFFFTFGFPFKDRNFFIDL